MNGQGTMIFKDKTEFQGKFKNNKMHDEQAIFKYANGDVYQGGIAHGVKHSKDAEYIYASKNYEKDTKITYQGEFKSDIRVGKGEVTVSAPGLTANAELEENKAKATIEFPNENCTYTGEVSGDAIFGKGVLKHHDTGNVFIGEFRNNHKHGQGEFTLKNGEKFKGEFAHGIEMSSKSQYGRRS
mmetsp:Transcript_10183/g.8987  ORF Transcript_10183/g.8987 Transcript_10183/m.8987 type:complete len:184 (+) Transcript_10183:305-856(+)